MSPFRRSLLLAAALAGLVAPAISWAKDAPRMLVFSRTTGYRHAAIEPGIVALKAMGARHGMVVEATEDPEVFSATGLKDVAVLVLLDNTTKPDDESSEYLVGPKREALQAFVHRGGGVVGIHAAADSHYHWPWYGRMIGGWFVRHPKGTPTGTVRVTDPKASSARGLASPVQRADEWYYFQDQDPTAHLLAVLDPQSIGEADVNPNPAAWEHEFEGGRVFYTAMGHTPESYTEPWFLKHLEGGLNWVMRR